MSDIRKVITTLRPELTATNRYPPVEGDKGVYYARSGFLVTHQPPLVWTSADINVASENDVREKTSHAILTGSYFSTARTPLVVQAVDPRKMIIGNDNSLAGNITHTMPTAPDLMTAIKRAGRATDVTPGTVWSWTYINEDGANTVTLDFSAAGWGTRFGFGGGAATIAIGPGSSKKFYFQVRTTTPGSETIGVFAE